MTEREQPSELEKQNLIEELTSLMKEHGSKDGSDLGPSNEMESHYINNFIACLKDNDFEQARQLLSSSKTILEAKKEAAENGSIRDWPGYANCQGDCAEKTAAAVAEHVKMHDEILSKLDKLEKLSK